MNEIISLFDGSLVWLRPWALYLALLIVPIAFFSWQAMRNQDQWHSVVDSHLLNFLLQQGETSRSRWPVWLLSVSLLIAIIALAGPSWKQQSIPVFRTGDARVVLFDMSFSMDAIDVKPSRINRARHKLKDILNATDEGEIALIVYAGDAFIISPLTSDAKTIENMVPILNTGLMPIFGSEPVAAFSKAKELFKNAGKTTGSILWITDGIDPEDVDLIADEINGTQFDVRVLAVGTEQGAPIPLPNDQGFLTDDFGDIVLPTLKLTPFQKLSQKANVAFTQMTPDNKDVDFILGNVSQNIDDLNTDGEEENIEKQLDQGFWFLFALIPMLLLLFRKNTRVPGIAVCLLCAFTVPELHAGFWDDLWLNKNQQAAKAFKEQQHEQAATLFENPQWKGAAQYKSGDHQSAVDNFSQFDSADDYYNKGNALARQQKFDEAIKAYQEALNRNKGHEDAQFNKKLIEDLKQQQEQQDQEKQDSQDQQQDSEKENEQEQQSSEQDEESEQEQKEQQESQENQEQEQQEAQEQELKDERTEAEKDQALEQWLRKIPDDPGGLLRQKMINEYKRRGRENRNTKKVW